MAHEQKQLAAMVPGTLTLQGVVTFVWPLVTLLGLGLGRVPLVGSGLAVLLEVIGGIGLLLVRRGVATLASTPIPAELS
jgi:hypothetical protein